MKQAELSWLIRCLLSITFLLCSGAAYAEIGVTKSTIRLGQSAALSGPSGDLGREFTRGARSYFDVVNRQGGVHGRSIVLIQKDDQYEPEYTIDNTKQLIKEENIFTLFGYIGTPTTKAILPLIDEHKIPLVAPFTGAQILRQPFHQMIFNVRASYHQEIEAIIRYLLRYGREDIAVVYQDDAYGRDGLKGVRVSLAKRELTTVAETEVQRNSSHVGDAAYQVALTRPDAVIVISAYGTTASFVRALRAEGSEAQVMSVSFVGSNALSRALGPLGHGIGISQVVPFPWDAKLPLVRRYQKTLAAGQDSQDYNFVSLEGFISAMVVVRALQKAGPELDREAFREALESFEHEDFGGFLVDFSPDNHNGSDFTQLTFILGESGSFIH